MPAQVDGSVAEVLITSQQVAHELATVAEVLWGTVGTVPTQASDGHASVAEVLTTAGAAAHDLASVAEALWIDLTLRVEDEASVAEVLWGTPTTPPTQESAEYASVAEVLTIPPGVSHELASIAEVFVRYETAVADVQDIAGRLGHLATFDGSTSLGAISHYRWSWVAVPPGSTLDNSSQPYPDSQGTVPFDMTNNAVLYHCEELAGVTGLDTSGNGNNAVLSNITVPTAGNVGARSWGYGASTSVATLGTAASLASDWTIAFWFYNLAPNTAYRTGVRGQTKHHPIMVENGGDELGAYDNDAGVFRGCGFQMVPIEFTGWHHIVARGISDGVDFFVDGAFVGGVHGFRPSDVDGCYAIGNYQGGGQRFADRIDEVAVWNRALSGTEIADIFVLQSGFFAGVGITFPFLPDLEGTYTVNLQVISASSGLPDNDTGDAIITLSAGIMALFPLQGDALRMWAPIQGQRLRRRDEK